MPGSDIFNKSRDILTLGNWLEGGGGGGGKDSIFMHVIFFFFKMLLKLGQKIKLNVKSERTGQDQADKFPSADTVIAISSLLRLFQLNKVFASPLSPQKFGFSCEEKLARDFLGKISLQFLS